MVDGATALFCVVVWTIAGFLWGFLIGHYKGYVKAMDYCTKEVNKLG